MVDDLYIANWIKIDQVWTIQNRRNEINFRMVDFHRIGAGPVRGHGGEPGTSEPGPDIDDFRMVPTWSILSLGIL